MLAVVSTSVPFEAKKLPGEFNRPAAPMDPEEPTSYNGVETGFDASVLPSNPVMEKVLPALKAILDIRVTGLHWLLAAARGPC